MIFNVVNSALTEKENCNNRILSGSITIDENQNALKFLFNGTDYSMSYKIVDKNNPVYYNNYNLMMSEVGFDNCSDAYELSSGSAMEDSTKIGEN